MRRAESYFNSALRLKTEIWDFKVLNSPLLLYLLPNLVVSLKIVLVVTLEVKKGVFYVRVYVICLKKASCVDKLE
jgi:hypothetical protein